MRKLEAFFAALIFTMAVTFFIVFGIGAPNMAELGKGLVIPDIPRRAVMQAVGTVGAVIMPHNVYLHSALVQVSRPQIAAGNHVHRYRLPAESQDPARTKGKDRRGKLLLFD